MKGYSMLFYPDKIEEITLSFKGDYPRTYVRVRDRDLKKVIFRDKLNFALNTADVIWYRGSGLIELALSGNQICDLILMDKSNYARSDQWNLLFEDEIVFAKKILYPVYTFPQGDLKIEKPLGGSIENIHISYKDYIKTIPEKSLYDTLSGMCDDGFISVNNWNKIAESIKEYIEML